jgi:glycosyltransferase involved in cell wall biosynthesis
MKIGIDARFFGSIGKGLGRYTQKLIENLEKIDRENQYYIFLRKENWNKYQPQNRNFLKIVADIPWYGFREQFWFPKILKRFKLDLVHFPHFNIPIFYKGKFVVTIHDLILFHYPTQRASTLSPFIYLLKKTAYQKVIKNAIQKSQKIIAVSNYTREDIIKHFHVPKEKIFVTYEAVGLANKPLQDPVKNILKRYGIIKPYLLYVGNSYPHKNLERLVLVFREIIKKHPHLHLVLVGKEDYFYRRLKGFVSRSSVKNVVFTDYVSDEHLSAIYREALLYVFPSLYEGFGLPPLEAMMENTPVASSQASCLPEILGDAAVYFDPQAESEMAEIIEKAISDENLRQRLIQKGRERIKKFSWEKMAEETLRIYIKAGQ